MRVAIIDLGTNSVRFDVHQIGPARRVRQLHREKLMVRLGQGVFLDGKLDPEAMRRTLHAFVSFRDTASSLRANKIVAFGTSALREASDGNKLLELIRKRTGIEVRIITGAEEAQLIAQGILAREESLLKNRKSRFALVDIGGGSTEISLCRGKKLLHSDSFPLGTARLQQVFLKNTPPKPESIEQLRRYVRSLLLPKIQTEKWGKADPIIGSSGTIRALGKMLRKTSGGKAIERPALKKLVKSMSAMTATQLMGIPGMEPKRVDMILAGAILLEECMDAIQAKQVFPTAYSLRDGILEEELQLQVQHHETRIAFHLEDLFFKASRMGLKDAHLRQVVHLSETLFDRLGKVHQLAPKWRPYLLAAAILHDVGEAISPMNHEVHSCYVVKNSDYPSMDAWETEFVAQLCRWHTGGKVKLSELPFKNDRAQVTAFLKLLALLRIADALDRGHKGAVRIKSIRLMPGKVVLTLGGKLATDLELLRVEQKKELFEQVLGRTLVARRA